MIDVELKKFYDAVKDPSWPEIKNYIDFYNLPETVKQECYDVHGFKQRRDQIEDHNYWQNISTQVYQYQNLVYVPVTKCAHTYYSHLFSELGWEKKSMCDVDPDSVVMFGLLRHPFIRWVKGITEWLIVSYYDQESIKDFERVGTSNNFKIELTAFETDIQKINIKNMISDVIIGDAHSMPYTALFGDLINRINWIPMDAMLSDNEIKISIMDLFKKHNHNITLPLDTNREWQSSNNKLKIETAVQTLYESSPDRLYHLYKLYATDLKIFHNLIDTFDPTWQ